MGGCVPSGNYEPGGDDADGGTTRDFDYDSAGRLTSVGCYDVNRRLAYEYDSAGRKSKCTVQSLSLPPMQIGNPYVYTYYDDGKPQTIVDPDLGVTSFHYDSRGRLERKDLPNACYTTYDYNDLPLTSRGYASALNSLVHLNHHKPDDTLLCGFSYTYDKVGNVLTAADGTDTTSYTYDWLYRLKSDVRSGSYAYSRAYDYDILGNMTRKVADSVDTYFHYDAANRLQDYGASNTPPYSGNILMDYDKDGNLITKTAGSAVTHYEYDLENNLTKWTPPSGTASEFVYNANGERIQKTDSRGVIRYLYDGAAVIQELDTSGNPITTYNPGIWEQATSGTKRFYHADRLGSTTRLTDASGLPTSDHFVYDSYGNIIPGSGASDTRYKYVGSAGYYSDPDTGLVKLGARYYDPAIGRFITQDPSNDGLNWYAYADNNPIRNIDPTGQFSMDALQTSLDVVGLVPVVGEPVDAVNAVIYAVRGQWANAGLSTVAIVPGIGSIGTGGKLVGKAGKAVVGAKKAKTIIKASGKATKAAKAAKLATKAKAAKKGAEALVNLHHAWPKYLGGMEKQLLEELPTATHRAYHRLLDENLPRWKSAAYYRGLSA